MRPATAGSRLNKPRNEKKYLRPKTATPIIYRKKQKQTNPREIRQISRPDEASKLLFRRLWQAPVRIPELAIFGEDGELEEWMFYSNEKRCILRKKYENATIEKLQEKWLRLEAHMQAMHRGTHSSQSCAHLEGRGGRAVILRDSFEKMMLDAQKQRDRKIEIRTTGKISRNDLKNKRERYFFGPALLKKYTQPAQNTVLTCKYERTLDRPKNIVEARKIDFKMESLEFGQISHNAAYDDIDGNAAEIRVLTMPLAPKAIATMQSHYVPDAQRSSLEDFVLHGVYCRHKRIQSSTRAHKRLRRIVDEILQWLERRHGMVVTKIDLEFMIRANRKDMSSMSNPIMVTACTKLAWVQAEPMWEIPVGFDRRVSPTKRPETWSLERTTAPTVPLASLRGRGGMSDDEDDNDIIIEVATDPFAKKTLNAHRMALPRNYITGLDKLRPLARTGSELLMAEQMEAHALNANKQHEEANHLVDIALRNFKQSCKLMKRVDNAESQSIKHQRDRERDNETAKKNQVAEVKRRKAAELEIGRLQREMHDMKEKMKIIKKRLMHYEGEVKVMDELHMAGEKERQRELNLQFKRDKAMDVLVASVGFVARPKKKEKKGKKKLTEERKKDIAANIFAKKEDKDKARKQKAALEASKPPTIKDNKEAISKIDRLRKVLVAPGSEGYFGETIGGFLDVFSAIDVNDNGEITTDQFCEAMEILKIKRLDTDSIKLLAEAIDSDKSGTIEYSEFVNALLDRMQHARKKLIAAEEEKNSFKNQKLPKRSTL
jgi:hypothetical protein